MGLETFWFDGIALVNARAILYRFGMLIIGFGAFFTITFLQIALAVVRAGPTLCQTFRQGRCGCGSSLGFWIMAGY